MNTSLFFSFLVTSLPTFTKVFKTKHKVKLCDLHNFKKTVGWITELPFDKC